ncbi:MAG TPA: STAS domain-containing protein [Armatimonadota bacterium]|nr:STAS domain-containing protein [Armatimonadota bacterium]
MDLTAQVKEVSGVPIIGLSGEMDVHTSAQLRDAVLALLDKGAQKIVVNLDNVEYVDSTGLGTMVGVLKRMTEQNSKLCLVSSNPLINKVFDITGLTRIFTIKPTDAEAIASFESMTAPAL